MGIDTAGDSSGEVVNRQVITRLPPTGPSAGRARDTASTALRAWAVPEDLVCDIVLAASELVTNAIEHARGEVLLAIELLDGEIVLRVRDETQAPPMPVPHDPLSPRSRGLAIVQAVSSAWGHQTVQGGKWVWARFPLPAVGNDANPHLVQRIALPPRD
ncbi:MAG: ATP-binding protein [Actinomycetota bacterium]|nr:ATP-binding protein [Actinomycetota bacterium]